MSNKVKRTIAYAVSGVAYLTLAGSVYFGWEMGWWQPATAIIGFVGTTFGIDFTLPKSKEESG